MRIGTHGVPAHVNSRRDAVTQLYGGKSFGMAHTGSGFRCRPETMPYTQCEGFAEQSDGHLAAAGSDASEFSSGEESVSA